jgi:uncharacterized protein with beta-barrel porin domain
MLSAAKWGALVGVCSYLVLIVGLTLLNAALFGNSPADLDHPGALTFVCLGIFGLLFAFSAAGYFTGRETLRAGLGALSAVIAFAVYYLLSLIYTPDRSAASTASTTTTPAGAHPLPAVFQALAAIVAGLIVAGFAALMGWLGARPAVQQARKRLNLATATDATDSTDSTEPDEIPASLKAIPLADATEAPESTEAPATTAERDDTVVG